MCHKGGGEEWRADTAGQPRGMHRKDGQPDQDAQTQGRPVNLPERSSSTAVNQGGLDKVEMNLLNVARFLLSSMSQLLTQMVNSA